MYVGSRHLHWIKLLYFVCFFTRSTYWRICVFLCIQTCIFVYLNRKLLYSIHEFVHTTRNSYPIIMPNRNSHSPFEQNAMCGKCIEKLSPALLNIFIYGIRYNSVLLIFLWIMHSPMFGDEFINIPICDFIYFQCCIHWQNRIEKWKCRKQCSCTGR